MCLSYDLVAAIRRLPAHRHNPSDASTWDEARVTKGYLYARAEVFDCDRYSAALKSLEVGMDPSAAQIASDLLTGTAAAAAAASAARREIKGEAEDEEFVVAKPDMERGRALAADLMGRFSWLEEPLAVVETYADDGILVLRSFPPHREGETRIYWELTLNVADTAASATLARWRWESGMAERAAEPYPTTFTLLNRMVDAFGAALAVRSSSEHHDEKSY